MEIKVEDIPVGTVFQASGIGHVGVNFGLFLRTYDGIVMLQRPKYTWSRQQNPEVMGYVPVHIEITVKKPLEPSSITITEEK